MKLTKEEERYIVKILGNMGGEMSTTICRKLKERVTVNKEKIEEIANFYKENINREEMASGKRNLEKLHKNSRIGLDELFNRVKNYYEHLKATNKLGTQFTYRLRNFFGGKAYHEDYVVQPCLTPQMRSESVEDKERREFLEGIE